MPEKKMPFTVAQLEQFAAACPTPFHIYDEKGIRANARRLKAAFAWNPGFLEYFAVKACPNPFIMKILTLGQVGEPHGQLARSHRETHVCRHRNQETVATLGHRHDMAGDLMAVPVCNGDGSVIAASFGEQFQQAVAAGFDGNGIVVRHNNLLHNAT